MSRHARCYLASQPHTEAARFMAGVCSGVAFLARRGSSTVAEPQPHWVVADTFRARLSGVEWRTDLLITEDSGALLAAAE